MAETYIQQPPNNIGTYPMQMNTETVQNVENANNEPAVKDKSIWKEPYSLWRAILVYSLLSFLSVGVFFFAGFLVLYISLGIFENLFNDAFRFMNAFSLNPNESLFAISENFDSVCDDYFYAGIFFIMSMFLYLFGRMLSWIL